jgi:hypothetical protein
MAYNKGEKTLGADIDRTIVDEFLSQASSRGFTKKRVLAAAIRHWIELPLEVQASLLRDDGDRISFNDLVSQIVDEKIQKTLQKKSTP